MMRHLLLDEIAAAAGGRILRHDMKAFCGLSIDSRTIKEGELFVALKGANFDGHDFLPAALKTGAGALVSRPPSGPAEGKAIICVGDTLKALQDIARHMRLRRNVPVAGVTGTNGKTTTKELLAAILGERHKVLKTQGNLNNHIGLPLCMANMDGDEGVMVLEMGSNAEGDISLLCEIARPDFAVVTNVGPAHLEGFGSLETVRKTDLEILGYVRTACVNADDLFLMDGIKGFKGKMITYGIDHKADVYAGEIVQGERSSRFRLCLPGKDGVTVDLKVPGRFNILNALGAAAAANEMGIDPGAIKQGLESFTGVPMRLEIREVSGLLVIRDVYNANPASVEGALRELVRLKKKRTVAVLGDMLELGAYSGEEHLKTVRMMSELHIDVFIAVGEEMLKAADVFKGECYRADDSVKAGSVLSDIIREGDTVLIKGSRGMRMERVLEGIGEPAVKGAGHAV